MKKTILKAALVLAVFVSGSISANAQLSNILGKVAQGLTGQQTTTTTTTESNNQSTTGSLLGGIVSGLTGTQSNSSSTSGGILNTIGSLLTSKLIPSSTQIVGTWVYQEPAVVLTSSNVLTSTAGSLASKTIETKLQSYLTKAGIKKGKASITFNEDKTFSINYGTKKITGTYTVTDSNIALTFTGRTNPSKLTPQLNNGSLVIAADASSIKTFMQNIGSNSGVSSISTVSTLLKKFDGMQIGMRLEKQ